MPKTPHTVHTPIAAHHPVSYSAGPGHDRASDEQRGDANGFNAKKSTCSVHEALGGKRQGSACTQRARWVSVQHGQLDSSEHDRQRANKTRTHARNLGKQTEQTRKGKSQTAQQHSHVGLIRAISVNAYLASSSTTVAPHTKCDVILNGELQIHKYKIHKDAPQHVVSGQYHGPSKLCQGNTMGPAIRPHALS